MKKTAFFSKTKPSGWWPALLLLSCFDLNAQCNPDILPPTAVCRSAWTVQTNQHGPNMTRIAATSLNNGSSDNCSLPGGLSFRVTLDTANTPPATSAVDLNGLNTFVLRLWVSDRADNWSRCTVQVTTVPPVCNPDAVKPTCVPDPNVTISRADYNALQISFLNFQDAKIKLNAAFGTPAVWDNCDNGNIAIQESYYLDPDANGPLNKIERRFFVRDLVGNTAIARQTIDIVGAPFTPEYVVHVPGWRYPEAFATDSMWVNGPFYIVPYHLSDSTFAGPCQGGYTKIEREWGLINWKDSIGVEGILPPLDVNNDGILGDPYNFVVIGDSVWLYQNGVPTQRLIKRAHAYLYRQQLLNSRMLRGKVFLDTLSNCNLNAGEPGIAGFKVKAIGQTTQHVYSAFADANGAFELLICTEDTLVELGLDLPYHYSGSCPSTYFVPMLPGPPAVQNIPVPLNSSCDLLSVDIATWRLRPCRTGTYYVNYCNYSDETINNTYIDVKLDTFLQFTTATLPGTPLGGNTFRFQTGNLNAGVCDSFSIRFMVACDVPLGITHCTEAHIYPTDDCPASGAWSGADLRVNGLCDGDSVRLQIKNVGSSGMAQPLEFVVTEDLIMAKTAPFQLGAGGTLTVSEPSNGATWRMETPQEPGHPWGGVVATVIEGCGGLNTPGLVNMLPVNDPDPFSSTDCTQNTAAYDPNDKQAFPQGYRDAHFIKANTDIEYMIRFQNTGTDTAFTVVLFDTLSALLDAATVRPGASSHAFDFDRLPGNVLRFRFDNILLPDSNVNEAASHGFVKFRIRQQKDNAPGTVILNRAGIYFDFNPVVMTNTTWHTIGENFLTVRTHTPSGLPPLQVYPNPVRDHVYFNLPDDFSTCAFVLSDALGRTVFTQTFSGNRYRFERGSLPAGMYFYNISCDRGIYTGTIVLP